MATLAACHRMAGSLAAPQGTRGAGPVGTREQAAPSLDATCLSTLAGNRRRADASSASRLPACRKARRGRKTTWRIAELVARIRLHGGEIRAQGFMAWPAAAKLPGFGRREFYWNVSPRHRRVGARANAKAWPERRDSLIANPARRSGYRLAPTLAHSCLSPSPGKHPRDLTPFS